MSEICIDNSAEELLKKGTQLEQSKQYIEAFECYLKSAELGYVYGMYNLAWCFQHGKGTAINEEKALHWMQESANKNFDQAQLNVGLFYLNGANADANKNAMGVMYIGLAAKQNHPTAQRLIAEFYQRGLVLEKDLSKAFDWYLLSAEAGDKKAQHNVGCMYQRADGVAQDHEKACLWFARAAKQDYQPSLQALQAIANNRLNPFAKQTTAKLNFMEKVL